MGNGHSGLGKGSGVELVGLLLRDGRGLEAGDGRVQEFVDLGTFQGI